MRKPEDYKKELMERRAWPYLLVVGLVAVTLVGFLVFRPGAWSERVDLRLQPDHEGIVALGAQIYASECASCHGADLEGQPNWRRRGLDGRLPAPPHDATGHTWHHPDADLFRITKDGTAVVVGGDYESDMPGFGDTLSDAEIIAVLSYIKSTWPEEIREAHDGVNDARTGGE